MQHDDILMGEKQRAPRNSILGLPSSSITKPINFRYLNYENDSWPKEKYDATHRWLARPAKREINLIELLIIVSFDDR